MKCLRLTAVLLAVLGALTLALAGDDDEGAQLLSNMSVQWTLLEGQGYTVSHGLVDRLEQGEVYEEYRTLYANNDYKIVGLGGPGVKDFDMYVYDSDGDIVEKDADTTNVPIISFHVSETGRYRIKSKVYKVTAGTAEDKECLFSYCLGWKRGD